MRKFNVKVILLISLAANILLLPLNYLSWKVADARFAIYEYVAENIMGNPEIVFTGDSITRNGGIWAFRINRYDFRTSNIAISGIDVNGIKYITLKAIDKKPKCIFIMAGRNDMPTNYKEGNAQSTISTYKQLLDMAIKKGIKVYVTSTLYWVYESHPEIIDELNTFLNEYCTENGQVYIDLNAKLSSNGKLREEFTPDGVHINEKAYDIWAGMIARVLK